MFCGAETEGWGAQSVTPAVFVAYDVDSLRLSKLHIAVSSEPLSRGIYLELGVSIALRLPVVMFLHQSVEADSMLRGLEALNLVEVVRYDAESAVPDLVRGHEFRAAPVDGSTAM